MGACIRVKSRAIVVARWRTDAVAVYALCGVCELFRSLVVVDVLLFDPGTSFVSIELSFEPFWVVAELGAPKP